MSINQVQEITLPVSPEQFRSALRQMTLSESLTDKKPFDTEDFREKYVGLIGQDEFSIRARYCPENFQAKLFRIVGSFQKSSDGASTKVQFSMLRAQPMFNYLLGIAGVFVLIMVFVFSTFFSIALGIAGATIILVVPYFTSFPVAREQFEVNCRSICEQKAAKIHQEQLFV